MKGRGEIEDREVSLGYKVRLVVEKPAWAVKSKSVEFREKGAEVYLKN